MEQQNPRHFGDRHAIKDAAERYYHRSGASFSVS
jgi:hypothetical protein